MVLCFISLISFVAFASENGGFYQCNPTALSDKTNPLCIFEASSTAPETWTTVGPHVVDQSLPTSERGISDIEGKAKVLSAKPWVNGDDSGTISSVAAMGPFAPSTTNTGEEWNNVLIFELIAVLRNKLMFDPESLFEKNEWEKYTRVLTDCNVKQVKEINDECHTGYSMDEVYQFMTDASSSSFSHHYLLQFLEEGAIDVVCLVAEPGLDERCDIARANMGLDVTDENFSIADNYCDCWMDAYREIYPDQPDPMNIVDVNFQTCVKQEPYLKDECESETGGTGGGAGGPTCCDGSTADMTTTPPSCADGSSPLPPDSTDSCPEDDSEEQPAMTEQPTAEPTELVVVVESEDKDEEEEVDCSTSSTPCCCDGSSPDTSSMPPTCDDGSNALQPGTACASDVPVVVTDSPTKEPTDQPTAVPTDEPTEGMPEDPCSVSTGPCCCDGSTPDMSSRPPACEDGEKPLSPGGVCEIIVTDEPTAFPTEEAKPTGPFCCDGSTPDMSSRPPKCSDGSNSKAPTGSCDDGHSMQSKCNKATNNIIVFEGADVIAYACEGEDAEALNTCSGDTVMCTLSQMERVGMDCNGSNAFYDAMCGEEYWFLGEGLCQCGGVIEMEEEDESVLGTLCCEEVEEEIEEEVKETEHSQTKREKKKAKKKLAKKIAEKLRLMKNGLSKEEAKRSASSSKTEMSGDDKEDAAERKKDALFSAQRIAEKTSHMGGHRKL